MAAQVEAWQEAQVEPTVEVRPALASSPFEAQKSRG